MVDCPENSTLEVCDLIDEAGTGIAVLTDRLAIPLGTFILILVIVGAVAGFFGAIIAVIVGSIKRIKMK